jgi:hypothetical protein
LHMSPPHGPKDPVVEPTPGDETNALTVAALRQRIHQQELLAELGVLALQRTGLPRTLPAVLVGSWRWGPGLVRW